MIIWLALLVTACLVFRAALTNRLTQRRQTIYYGLLVVLAASMSSADAAPPKLYNTLVEAANAGLDEADALAPRAEAGGTVFMCVNKFVVIDVVTDHDRDHVKIPIPNFKGCILQAIFHTHPKDDSRFSPTDILSTCDHNTLGIIRAKESYARVFDCRNLSYAEVNELAKPNRLIYGEPLK